MKVIEKLKNRDWEFVEEKTNYATHGIHRYSSKYIPQIPNHLIRALTKEGEIVLDPFVGSGTTLVEANRIGRRAIGVDMNPVAFLISKVKTTPLDRKILDNAIANFIKTVAPKITSLRSMAKRQRSSLSSPIFNFSYTVPTFHFADRWYQKNVLAELAIIKDSINEICVDDNLKNFFVCAFSAISRNVSNASSGYGNLMIDKNKREINNTFEVYQNQLIKMRGGIAELSLLFDPKSTIQVHQADASNMSFLKDNSVDCIVTHPPYISAVPYAEYLRLSLLWLEEGFGNLFSEEFSQFLNYKKLDAEIIGGKRNRKDVVERFDISMFKVFQEMFRVLKNDKYCAVVIGNPVVRGKLIACDQMFINFGKKTGFKFIGSIRRGKYKTTMGKMKEEFILIFRK